MSTWCSVSMGTSEAGVEGPPYVSVVRSEVSQVDRSLTSVKESMDGVYNFTRKGLVCVCEGGVRSFTILNARGLQYANEQRDGVFYSLIGQLFSPTYCELQLLRLR